jgi:hypothetical protein
VRKPPSGVHVPEPAAPREKSGSAKPGEYEVIVERAAAAESSGMGSFGWVEPIGGCVWGHISGLYALLIVLVINVRKLVEAWLDRPKR